MLRSSVDRSGELLTKNWEFSEWCKEDNVFIMNWSETKTGSEKTLLYWPDVDW